MLDKIFGGALTFILLAGGTAAIGSALWDEAGESQAQVARANAPAQTAAAARGNLPIAVAKASAAATSCVQ